MSESKPCPFCGGEMVWQGAQGGTVHYHRCTGCGLSTPHFGSKKEAEEYCRKRYERECEMLPVENCNLFKQCSNCGALPMPTILLKDKEEAVLINYCPNCGAKVRGKR